MRERLSEGKLHALVNNAAISPKGPRGERLGVLASDMEMWRQVFEVNFFAIIALARGLIEELTSAKGAIVNVPSISASVGMPGRAPYCASKAGIVALTCSPSSGPGAARA